MEIKGYKFVAIQIISQGDEKYGIGNTLQQCDNVVW